MVAPSTPQQHHWELWDSIAAARLQKIPIASSYAVYMSNKFMSNEYSISTRSRLQGCSAPPTSSRGSLADAQWDFALLPCFSQLTVLGWGARHLSPRRPVPWFSAGLPLSPSQGLCRGLEPGQRSLCSALSDARRRTGSLPAAGISTPGTSQPAGTPCFPLRGQRQRHIANHHRHELRGLSSAARAGHAAGNSRGGFCLLHLHPAPSPPRDAPGPIRLWQSTQCRSCEPLRR